MSSVITSTASEADEVVVTEGSINASTTTSAGAVKAQVVPFVYTITSINKNNPSNMVVNSVPQIQFATLPKNTHTRSISNPGVILAPVKGKTQQLVIHKPGNMQTLPVVPVSVASSNKLAGAYLTMIKPVPKLSDQANKDNYSSVIQTTTSTKKYVLAPVSKVIKNRLPVTVTTNSKFAFMPLTIPQTSDDGVKTTTFNIKIADGHLQKDASDSDKPDNYDNPDLTCNEIIDLNSPNKSEKEYELSIVEDSNSKTESITIIDSDCNIKRKEGPKFAKHGISILKKNYHGDKVRPFKPSSVLDIDVELQKLKLQKPERRRKSNFSYRRDYDDMEITIQGGVENFKNTLESSDLTLTKLDNPNCNDSNKENKDKDFLEIEVIKEKTDSVDDCNMQKLLKWDDDVGSLPGSNLKFIINEFNLLEYVTKEEYDKIINKKLNKAKDKVKNQFQEDLQCVECGCYGSPSEFITPKYCSLDCKDSGHNKLLKEKERTKPKRRKRAFPAKKSSEIGDQSNSDEDDTSNDNSQDKYSYPWACSKRGFSWSKYLDHLKVKGAPVKLFKDAFPYNRNGFKVGMKLEGIDPHHPSYFCVLNVSHVCGYRVRLHFDGYPDNYDFWVNADSMDIFPMGWCEKHGHVLQPPPGYTVDNFSWPNYLKQTKSPPAPKHLFANRAGNVICPNGFRVGMKLEAVDRKNTSLVCVATIKDMMDNRILIHFDSWDDIYDYWVDPTSPYIHPVGWCDQNGHNLTPPNDYPNPETFSWNKYLKETKAVAAPVRAFKQRPVCGFKKGMRLECVDKRVPQLIRVATVDDVRDHQIRISFDGWPDRYSYWVDDDSEDIHPVGWCHKTGHPIEAPLTPDDVYDFLECPTVGCRGLGHIEGAKYATHSEQKYCPYAEDNIDIDRVLTDRLLTPDRFVEAVVPVSREPKDKLKVKVKSPPKIPPPDEIKPEVKEEDDLDVKPKRKYRKRLKLTLDNIVKQEATSFIEQSKIDPAVKESWDKHSQFLKEYIRNCDDPRDWLCHHVYDFVSKIPGCRNEADEFRYMDIDGEAFLSLSQQDLIEYLHIKIGPAVKLYNIIVLLRQRVLGDMYS